MSSSVKVDASGFLFFVHCIVSGSGSVFAGQGSVLPDVIICVNVVTDFVSSATWALRDSTSPFSLSISPFSSSLYVFLLILGRRSRLPRWKNSCLNSHHPVSCD